MSTTSSTSVIFISYANPGDIVAAGVVLPVMGILAVILRFFVRYLKAHGIAADDWLLIPAVLFVIGYGASLIAGVKRHALGYDTPPPTGTTEEDFLNNVNTTIEIVGQLEFAMTILMTLSYAFIKLSILFFYRRIFVTIGTRVFNFVTWFLIGIVITWTIAFVFLFIFSCGIHFSAAWTSRAALIKHCPAGLQHEESLYVSEFITNILLLLAPLPSIWRLHLKTSRKFAVSGILLLAFMALAASIVRLIIVLQVVSSSLQAGFDEDQTISTIFYWGMIEAGIALVACCLPTLKSLISEQGVASAIHSIRSVRSLQSINSHVSGGSRQSQPKSYNKMLNDGVNMGPLRGDDVMETNSQVDVSSIHSNA